MSSAADRLASLREKLEKGRGENLKAIEDEGKRRPCLNETVPTLDTYASSSDEDGGKSLRRGRRVHRGKAIKRERSASGVADVGSADEADGEDADSRLRSMKRRAKRAAIVGEAGARRAPGVVEYGVTGRDVDGRDVDRMVGELEEVDKRREKFCRRRAFHEDRSDITFINEGNRVFNRVLDKHFDQFDAVKKIKDSLERGTA